LPRAIARALLLVLISRRVRSLSLFLSFSLSLSLSTLSSSVRDRIRLFAIAVLESGEQLSAEDIEGLQALMLGSPGAETAEAQAEIRNVCTFLTKRRRMQTMSATGGAGTADEANTKGWGLLSQAATTAFAKATASVKSALASMKMLPITRIVADACDVRATPATEQLLHLDPKTSVSVDAAAASAQPLRQTPFSTAIVFVIGGGSYVEFQNLDEFATHCDPPRRVIYGATEMLSAEKFLAQMAHLGST
jgi:hypothetical protein